MDTTFAIEGPQRFQCLCKSRDGKFAVEDVYNRNELKYKLVVRDEYNANSFLVFDTLDDFTKFEQNLPEDQRCFHEIIFDFQPQRLKFDMDIKNTFGDLTEADATAMMRKVCSDILDELLETYGSYLTNSIPTERDLLITSSHCAKDGLRSGGADSPSAPSVTQLHSDSTQEASLQRRPQGGRKYSFHIIVTSFYVESGFEAGEFARKIIANLPPDIARYVDGGVYKHIQSFRMLGSTKKDEHRPKVLSVANYLKPTPAQAIKLARIGAPINARVMPRCFSNESVVKHATVASLCLEVVNKVLSKIDTSGHEFTFTKGQYLCFRRLVPSFCKICGEIHHNDNTLLIAIYPKKVPATTQISCNIIEYCRQKRGAHIAHGTILVDKDDLGDDIDIVDTMSTQIEGIISGKIDPHEETAFEKLGQTFVNSYSQDSMRDYELVDTLAVKAQMKLGKTKALRKYLDTHFPADSIKEPKIRFVTFRQTFSHSITKDFPNFELYSSITGDITYQYPRVIIQVESLHRLIISGGVEPPDLVILDECESIFDQFNSGLAKHFSATFAVFQWMLRNAAHVICMDANLGDRTFNILRQMRPDRNIHFHNNVFKKAAGDCYYFIPKMSEWVDQFRDKLTNGKKIVVPTNSLEHARACEELVRSEFKNKRVKLYSSETLNSEKTKHFGDVNKYWAEYDVLIYTPTCSAGVSFEIEHFDMLFGYFVSTSCNVETCRQMIGRVRNLKMREHYIHIVNIETSLPTTPAGIRAHIRSKRAQLYASADHGAMQFSYAPDGSINFHETEFFKMWVENTVVTNLSRNKFRARFINQVADSGATIAAADSVPKNEDAQSFAEIKEMIRMTKNEKIASAPDITSDEVVEIRELIEKKQDLSSDSYTSLEKYMLRDFYQWRGEINADFVETYNDDVTRQIFRNLQQILCGVTPAKSLDIIKERELYRYESKLYDIKLLQEKKNFNYTAHMIAMSVLKNCGFSSILCQDGTTDVKLEPMLKSFLPKLMTNAEQVKQCFDIKSLKFNLDDTGQRFLKSTVRHLNKIVSMMYGCEICQHSAEPMYILKHFSLGVVFTIDPANKSLPLIACNYDIKETT